MRSCREKPFLSYEKIFKFHRTGLDVRENDPALPAKDSEFLEEKAYFFQPVLVTKTRLLFYEQGRNEADYQALIDELSGSMQRESAVRIVGQAKLHSVLESMPLRLLDNKLLIDLPHWDHQRCGNGAAGAGAHERGRADRRG